MTRKGKTLIVALALALPMTAGLRFIHHTDRDYAAWIEVFGASAALLAKRCSETQSPGVCAAARARAEAVSEFVRYRTRVNAWHFPFLFATLLAWAVVAASGIGMLLERRPRSGRGNRD